MSRQQLEEHISQKSLAKGIRQESWSNLVEQGLLKQKQYDKEKSKIDESIKLRKSKEKQAWRSQQMIYDSLGYIPTDDTDSNRMKIMKQKVMEIQSSKKRK